MEAPSSGATSTAASSSTIESRPPESATAMRAPPGAAAQNGISARRTASSTGATCAGSTRARASAGSDLLESAIREQLVLARLEQRVEWLLGQLTQRVGQRLLERNHNRRMIAVRAAERFVDDLVDEAELLQARRGDAEDLGRFGRLLGGLPQDRRTAFGRDHRICRVLQHQRDVADRDRERAAGAALADHRDDDRHAKARHLEQIAADRLRLAAFLGADARVRARRVDEREQRKPELRGETHEPQRLAIALGTRHAEIAPDLLLRVAALLMADDHARRAIEAREAADDRRVVGEGAIAGELAEVAEHAVHVVKGVRPLRVARDLRDLPRGELRVDLLGELLALLLQPADLVGDVDGGVLVHVAKLVDLRLQFGDRLLEIEKGLLHRDAGAWGETSIIAQAAAAPSARARRRRASRRSRTAARSSPGRTRARTNGGASTRRARCRAARAARTRARP